MDRTIIYIDDDSDDLLFFGLALEKADPEAVLVNYKNPDQFLSKITELNLDNLLIFLDVNMPIKNGFQVLKEIRQQYNQTELPVIMLSTSDNENTISVAREFGASAYAVKPNDIAELIVLIKKLIEKNWKLSPAEKDRFVYS